MFGCQLQRLAFFSLSIFILAGPAAAEDTNASDSDGAAISVPEGNRNVEQPDVPAASVRRTRQTKSTFERKYERILRLLQKDERLRGKIVDVAELYEIDPLHIVGALVGEHTYNVDAYDRLQSYYVKALAYARGGIRFRFDGQDVDEFIRRSEFEQCLELTDSYALWSCREAVWEEEFRNRRVDEKDYPDNRFSAVFFQPFYAGQTFGLGQLNPLTALKLTDAVHAVSGYRKLSHRRGDEVYSAIMNPDVTLAYVAAILRRSIDVYESIAGFDISANPGITATLYNVGNPDARAEALAEKNRGRQTRGLDPILPQENYYGWLVNDRLDELEALFTSDLTSAPLQ
ncbi:MAG: DUF1402 family protein [Pseudomonadota bacterium]